MSINRRGYAVRCRTGASVLIWTVHNVDRRPFVGVGGVAYVPYQGGGGVIGVGVGVALWGGGVREV